MIKMINAASWLARRRFYSFSHTLYRDCFEWREPEAWGGKRVISRRYNPLLRHPHAFLLAMKNDRPVARMLVGCVKGRGYFSMFDAEEDVEVVRRLMAEAASWQKKHGVREMLGPIAPHPLDLGGGILIEGFDERAAFCDAYNAPYYNQLLMDAGAVPFGEQLAYHVNRRRFDMEKYGRAASWAKKRFGYEVAEGVADNLRALNEAICQVMGEEANPEGMACAIDAVRPYLLKEMCPFVCVDGKPVGYLLTIRGRYGIDGRTRFVTMWVHKAWRRKGVTALLFDAAARAMAELGMEEIDASWVQSDNKASVQSIENAGGQRNHRYRMYRVDI